MVLGAEIEGVVINPFDPIRKMIRPGGVLYRTELDLLSKQLIPSHIEPHGVEFKLKPGYQTMIGAPAVLPGQRVIEALRAAAAEHRAIAELYIFQIATAESSQTVIGVEPDQKMHARGNGGELVRGLANTIQKTLDQGQFLDFMLLSGKFAEQVKAQFTPIYRRKSPT